MPPVFGPGVAVDRRACSPAPARADRASRRRRTATSSETSGPVRPSSITTRAAGVAERGAREVGAHGVARLGERLGDDARPCPRRARRSSRRRARAASRGTRARRPPRRRRTSRAARSGTPAATSTSFIHAFEPSSRARPRRARTRGGPRARTASATPATSGSSGPTTTRSASSSSASSATAAGSVGVDRDALADRRPCPGCPGAADHLVDVRRTRAAPTRARARARPTRRRGPVTVLDALTRRGEARSSDRGRDRRRRG